MTENAKFIWLSKELYPNLQESSIGFFAAEKKKYQFGVAAFKKGFEFDKNIKYAEIEVFGDTRYYLWTNSIFVGTGPCPTAGDFDMPTQYSSKYIVEVGSKSIDFFARVQLTPTVQTDNSKGKGGFILEARLVFDDGSDTLVYTDESWFARREREYLSPWYMDYTRKRCEWSNAILTENIWNVVPSQIKNLKEETVSSEKFVTKAKSTAEFNIVLDRIYSAYSVLDIKAKGEYKIELITSETRGISERKHWIKGNKSEYYRSNEYYAVGEYKLIVDNMSDEDIEITAEVVFVCYPSDENGYFKCSDDILNRIWELGKWTVKICRQQIELDSPVHQENLLCTSDYMIESLVNDYTTGDYSLTRFDVYRMGQYLRTTDGYIYGSNYAILWMNWLYEYYLYSGDVQVFQEVLGGMEAVLKRYRDMENTKGLLEEVTGYSFVDWSYVDGHSMFEPPRALGETVANAYYYNMIIKASEIYAILGMTDKAEHYKNKAEKYKKIFNETFFDKEKGLYFDGLNDSSPCNTWIPENTNKRYYTRYSNTLSVLFGLCDKDKEAEIMEWVLKPENLEGVQPYFMHYVIEAVYKTGLFGKYGMSLLRKWKVIVEDCEKGMHEVWKDFEEYETDYSHGWGATPTYQLPNKLLGLEIIEPGFKKIHINPNLYGLKWADIKVPTPYGVIICHMEEDKEPEITIPEEIRYVF